MESKVVLKRSTFLFLITGTLLGFFLVVSGAHTVFAKDQPDEDVYRHLKVFTDVMALVQKNYVEEVDFEKIVDGAIRGMMQSLDPHSSYLTPDVYKELQVDTKGEFGGLGIEITIKDNLLTVVSPIEDSPAARAGVESGDQIIKIDEEFSKNLTPAEAVRKMRGPKGTPVVISVQRKGYPELLPITVVRDIIKVKSIRWRMLENEIGYVRLTQFQEASAKEFTNALETLVKDNKGKDLNGLVIDLRNNPGGLLTQAIRVTDLFIKEGIIVYTDGRLESQRQKYYAHDDKNEPEYPIVVLVNGGSASAAEIVSGALQDHGRALILGNQTFGKGSVQTILPMENDSALRLTTALYFTKNGRSIQAQGIAPDVVVPAQRLTAEVEDEAKKISEKSLPGAIKNPTKQQEEDAAKLGSNNAMQMQLSELLKQDPQLEEALRLLKTWRVFQGGKAPQLQQAANNTVAQ